MISIFVLFFELIVLFILKQIGIDANFDILHIVFIFLFSVSFFATLRNKYHYISAPLFLGYVFRVLLLIFDLYARDIYSLPNSGADSEAFYQGAIIYAQSGELVYGEFFTKLLGTIFRLIGTSRVFGQFLVLLFSIVSLIFASKILELLKADKNQIVKTMWILCLLPNFAILSSIFLRESIITMFITISLYAYVLWIKKKNEKYFLLALAFSFIGALFHSGAVAAAFGYALSRILYDNKTGKIKITAKNVVLASIFLLLGIFLFNNYGDVFFSKFSGMDSIADITSISAGKSRGNSSYAQYVGDSSNIFNMIIYTVPRIFFFLLSPMPWMIRGLSDIIAFLFSSCFYLISIISVIRFLLSNQKKNRELVIVLFIVAICATFVFAWGTANAGTACRHRDKMTIVWGVLLGLTSRDNSENKMLK